MENQNKEYVISINPNTHRIVMFVKELNVSFTVDTDAEYAILGDADIPNDTRGRISLITRMCKNKTFVPSVLATGNSVIQFDYKDFMNMIMINYAEQVNPINPTIQ